jgi:hypothetical protein
MLSSNEIDACLEQVKKHMQDVFISVSAWLRPWLIYNQRRRVLPRRKLRKCQIRRIERYNQQLRRRLHITARPRGN